MIHAPRYLVEGHTIDILAAPRERKETRFNRQPLRLEQKIKSKNSFVDPLFLYVAVRELLHQFPHLVNQSVPTSVKY